MIISTLFKGVKFFYLLEKVSQATHSLPFEINGILLFLMVLSDGFDEDSGYYFISVWNPLFWQKSVIIFLTLYEIINFNGTILLIYLSLNDCCGKNMRVDRLVIKRLFFVCLKSTILVKIMVDFFCWEKVIWFFPTK